MNESSIEMTLAENQCAVCGSPLNPAIYFCTTCAKPWRDAGIGLGPVPEPVWDPETRIRLRSPEAYTVFFVYLAALFVADMPRVIMGGSGKYDIVYLAFNDLCVAAATLWIAYRNWETIRPALNLKGLSSPWFLAGAAMLVPLLAINYGYHSVIENLITRSGSADEIGKLAVGHPVSVFLLVCVMPALSEEIGYRAFTYPVLLRALSPWPAALLTSALFATLHLSFWSWPYLFLVGLFLNQVATRTKSVLPSMVLHAVHNAAVAFVFPFIGSTTLR
jgi:membrane protease YdiL (CAAX protease family)